MAFPTPSIGDILMLSQLAWRIGCAFTAGRAGAPAEFQEVENELKSLTTAITSLAESVDNDEGILSRSDQKTREGLHKILGCCQQTLDNLDAFVNQYQEIRRPDETGGLAVQRSWKHILIKNWKMIWWTTEGGSVQSLRNMLAMHVQSIMLTMQALQSRSLSRLERIIEPVADQIDGMHNKLNGDLDIKIDEMHHVMLSLRASLENGPMVRPLRIESLSSLGASPTTTPIQRKSDASSNRPEQVDQSHSPISIHTKTPQETPELSDSEFSAYSPMDTSKSDGPNSLFNRESLIIPSDHQYRIIDTPPRYERSRHASNTSSSSAYSPGTISKPTFTNYKASCERPFYSHTSSSSILPPSVMTHESSSHEPSYTPSYAPSYTSSYPDTDRDGDLEPAKSQETQIYRPLKGAATVGQHNEFKRLLFENAATLCEVRGQTIEYTQPDDEKVGEWKMVDASSQCDIALVRKRQKLSSGAMRFSTSIWSLSDDRCVRLEQTLSDGEEVIPYTVWGNVSKVVLRVATELKFHDTSLDANPLSIAKTSWVNYIFENERAATKFQDALIGRTLLLSVRTRRTMRIHDGLTGAFAYAEQLCGLENLRIFQDHSTGGVLAIIHYTPQFRNGYMAFSLNSNWENISIRDDGENTIKVKGLAIPVDAKSVLQRRNSGPEKKKGAKYIAGARIEFYTAMDKALFMAKFREVRAEAGI